MQPRLTLHKINFTNSGSKMTYQYSYDESLAKYFNDKEPFYVQYQEAITSVPESLAVIPFLANVMPIAWFVGFDVVVNELDETFYQSLQNLKAEFSKYYPQIMSNNNNNLILNKVIGNSSKSTKVKNAMLFSAGVDAYTTYLRHFEEELDLITIHGADIKTSDFQQWNDLMMYMDTNEIIAQNRKHYIKSNIRDFITFEVDKLVDYGWWGKIQHGLALTTLSAPIAFLHSFKIIYIASTRSIQQEFSPWGSMPQTDNLIKWGDSSISHDGYELSRFMKVKTILNISNYFLEKPQIRVCYNEHKNTLNCNTCEKCCRTIFSILLKGKDPNKYGFIADGSFYDLVVAKIKNGFSTHGTRMYWEEMLSNYNEHEFFFFNQRNIESDKVELIFKTFNLIKDKPIGALSKAEKIKLQIINKFPKIFQHYLKLRRKF